MKTHGLHINPRLLRAQIFSIVALCSRNKEDKNVKNKDERDYIETTLRGWFGDSLIRTKRFYLPNGDFTLYCEFEQCVVFAHLGTQKGGWASNIFGYFGKAWRGWMHNGFGKAAQYTFGAIESLIVEAAINNKSIIHGAHSRGCPRAVGASMLTAEKYGHISHNYLFNPPPSLTKKGVRAYKNFELNNFTENIVPHDFDPVGVAGEIRFDDAPGTIIRLPDVNTTMSSLPAGAHAGSVAFEGMRTDALINKDQETVDWIDKTMGVCTA